MPSPSLVSVIRHLRRTAGAHAGIDDAALLERFAADRDEAAFELLVWRHGPMVLGVCNRRLGDVHAAEDAFQATFLALARRAKSIRRQASVAGWLYRVAGRVALAARERSTRRNELPLDELTPPGREPEPPDAIALKELRQALDAAVARLPARYRDPLVLTCFAGRSHAEAAQQLGCAVRTIESRLGRARLKLRATLLRRGFLPAGGLAAALVPANAPAGVATSLVMATVRAAGKGTASSSIETLTEGVLHAMLLSKLKIAGTVMFVAGLVGLGSGGWVYQSRAVGQDSGGETKIALPSNTNRDQPKIADTRKDVERDRVAALVQQLTDVLRADPSDEAMKQIQSLVDEIANRRQRAQREQEIQATLARLATEIAILEKMANGQKERESAIATFKAAFEQLNDRFVRRFAVADLVGTLSQDFSGGLLLRGLKSASAVPVAADPNAPAYMVYDKKTGLRLLGAIDSVSSRQVKINLIVGHGISVGDAFSVIRTGDDPRFIGKIRITSVKGQDAVGQVIETGWQQTFRAGDKLTNESQNKVEPIKNPPAP